MSGNQAKGGSNAQPFLFGHARRKITPTVPVSLGGHFNIRMWTAVLDDLYVDALVLRQDDQMAALVGFGSPAAGGAPRMTTATRRFRLRPSTVELSATGWCSPIPATKR